MHACMHALLVGKQVMHVLACLIDWAHYTRRLYVGCMCVFKGVNRAQVA